MKKPAARTARKPAAKHEWLRSRKMEGGYIVLCLSVYLEQPSIRGQFYPKSGTLPRIVGGIAIWPTEAHAMAAAKWAVKANPTNQYGIFRLSTVVQSACSPIRTIKI